MKQLQFAAVLFLLLFCTHAFAIGDTYYVECGGCDPADAGDSQVGVILHDALRYASVGDTVSIMTDIVDAGQDGHRYANWKYKGKGVWIVMSKGYARTASTGGSGTAGDGRTTVAIGPVIVMYPSLPTPIVSVEGIIQSGAGGGGCTLKTSGTDCASLMGGHTDGDGE